MRKIARFVIDAVVINISVAMAILLKCEFVLSDVANYIYPFLIGVPLLGISFVAVMYAVGGYRVLWQWAGTRDRYIFAFKAVVAALPYTVIHPLITEGYSVSVYLMSLLIMVVALLVLRAVYKLRYKLRKKKMGAVTGGNDAAVEQKKNIMIIGAGSAGNMLLQDVKHNFEFQNYRVACFIDDSESKIGSTLGTIKVVGNTASIPENVKKYDISLIVFAIPSCSNRRRARILELCNSTGCRVKTLPSLGQMINHEDVSVGFKDVREVQVEDLLGREPVQLDQRAVKSFVSGKTVMVTGGGGSIGSELCRQIAAYDVGRLIIFDIYENNAYDIQNELRRKYPELDLITLIGSVRDVDRLEAVFEKYRPEVVYHAAAHKHVPLMEDSPNEAVKNNVFGTLNVVRAADKFGVKRFILISTDKAVNPTNVMGATKRICEMIIQSYARRSKTEYVAVRFGNVLGSNGSVIPLFKRQIAEGGPVTVTDKNIIRYFMTIPEAVSLVLEASVDAHGGEIFVLDMGQPMKIVTLAENLIRLSGYEPGKDIKIVFTGLRPGEKLYEETLMDEEGLQATENNLIHIGKPIEVDEEKLFALLSELESVMADDKADIRQYIRRLVPTYHCPEN